MSEFKDKVDAAKIKVKRWCSDRYWDAKTAWTYHKDEIVGAVSLGGAIVTGGIKIYDTITIRQRRRANMNYHDRKMHYDPSTGSKYKLKRHLTNAEQMEINKRHAKGEDVGEILKEMRVLKR